MIKIPIQDLQRHYAVHAPALDRVATQVLHSGWWQNGPNTQAFCERFGQYIGVAHCQGVGNGTDALEIALRVLAANSKNGRSNAPGEVITVANAGGYTSSAVYSAGLVPVYVDIEYDSQLVSIPSVLSALSEHTTVVVVTHLYGGLVDVPVLRRALDSAGYAHLPILEDCAQAHGLSGFNTKAGGFDAMATFSFYPTKNLGAMGDGGAIVTNNAEYAAHIQRLHQYGWNKKYQVASPWGRNSRLDELQAALLLELLPELDAANERRQAILEAYMSAASDAIQIVRSPHATVAHLAVVMAEDRDSLRDYLQTRGIATDIHYPILDCDQQGWRDLPKKIAPEGLRVARLSLNRILTIPCFPALTDEEVSDVCKALAAYTPA